MNCVDNVLHLVFIIATESDIQNIKNDIMKKKFLKTKTVKRFAFSAILFFANQIANAQSWVASGTNLVTNNTSNVGIGITTPLEKLTIKNGNILLTSDNDKAVRVITAGSNAGMLYIGTDIDTRTLATNGPSIQMGGRGNNWRQGGIWYHSYAPAWQNAHIFINYNQNSGIWTNLLSMVDQNGYAKLAIGDVPSKPDGYSLFVQHGILTEKLKVALTTGSNWADYVFAKNYKLKSLPEVEKYIKANKHLPGVPAAQDLVKQGGIDMNEMFAKQMEKIEELTLYMIELQKQVEKLKKENIELKTYVSTIKN